MNQDKPGAMGADVTVIIPTTAQLSRKDEIRRCIASIRNSSRSPVDIIAVVNGSRFDAGICAWLKEQPDVQFVYTELGSAPNAAREGRERVRTPFFSYLDDDDEYLPDATDMKRAELLKHPEADLVVTNAYHRCGDEETLLYDHLEQVPRQPLRSLFDANWLHNGNALFRTASIGQEFFVNYTAYAEWTWLAYRLALSGKTVRTLEQPTFRVHLTPGSLSQSQAYFASYPELYAKMLAKQPPPPIRRLIERRIASSLHDCSEFERKHGRWLLALAYHLRSLCKPGGLQYLSYTRHLLRPRRPK